MCRSPILRIGVHSGLNRVLRVVVQDTSGIAQANERFNNVVLSYERRGKSDSDKKSFLGESEDCIETAARRWDIHGAFSSSLSGSLCGSGHPIKIKLVLKDKYAWSGGGIQLNSFIEAGPEDSTTILTTQVY